MSPWESNFLLQVSGPGGWLLRRSGSLIAFLPNLSFRDWFGTNGIIDTEGLRGHSTFIQLDLNLSTTEKCFLQRVEWSQNDQT
jgi:hypothetical protein